MKHYIFIACNIKLPTFEDALHDEQIKSYNELLAMGLTDAQIAIRGRDLSHIDRDAKVFLIMLPDELKNSPLIIEPDNEFEYYARYLTDKKYIYRVRYAEQALSHLLGYIAKYALQLDIIELWRVNLDDYTTDIAQQTKRIRNCTLNDIEQFFEADIPCQLTLVK